MVENGYLKTVNACYNEFIKKNDKDKEIMHFRELTITLGEIEEYVDLFTNHLISLGVKKGDRIAYTMPSRPECYYIFISASRIGAVVLPLFYMIPDSVKTQIIMNLDISLVITINDMLNSIKISRKKSVLNFKLATIDGNSQLEYSFTKKPNLSININDYILKDTELDLPVLLTTTSGTTGTPKFVSMTQNNIANEIEISKNYISPITENQNNGLSLALAFPLSTAGIITCMGILFAGVCQIFIQEISPVKFLESVHKWKADYISAPPAFLENLLNINLGDEYNFETVKGVFTGMDFLQNSLLKRLKEKFKNLRTFGNGYGLIETCNVVMVNKVVDKDDIENYPTNLMKLVEGVGNFIDIRDENGNSVKEGKVGELFIKGKSVVNGYMDEKILFSQNPDDKWFKTGDIVRNEGNNFITLLGRDKQLIKRGGKSVSPIYVQKIINEIKGVKSSCVVGVPMNMYGEMIWAFIVVLPEHKVELKDIMKYCRTNLVNYMVPDKVCFIDEIPKCGGAGKVNFLKLKEIAKTELIELNGGKYE